MKFNFLGKILPYFAKIRRILIGKTTLFWVGQNANNNPIRIYSRVHFTSICSGSYPESLQFFGAVSTRKFYAENTCFSESKNNERQR